MYRSPANLAAWIWLLTSAADLLTNDDDNDDRQPHLWLLLDLHTQHPTLHPGINPFGPDHHHLIYSLHLYLNHTSTHSTKGLPSS